MQHKHWLLHYTATKLSTVEKVRAIGAPQEGSIVGCRESRGRCRALRSWCACTCDMHRLYIHIYTYVYMTYIHMYIWDIYIYIYYLWKETYIHMYIWDMHRLYIHIYTYVWHESFIYTHIYIFECRCEYIFEHMYIYLHKGGVVCCCHLRGHRTVYMKCIYLYIYIYIYTYIYIYIHIYLHIAENSAAAAADEGDRRNSNVTWLIHVRDMTHSYMWHDSFMCVTWLIHVCDMTHSYVWHDSYMRPEAVAEYSAAVVCVSVTWLIHCTYKYKYIYI